MSAVSLCPAPRAEASRARHSRDSRWSSEIDTTASCSSSAGKEPYDCSSSASRCRSRSRGPQCDSHGLPGRGYRPRAVASRKIVISCLNGNCREVETGTTGPLWELAKEVAEICGCAIYQIRFAEAGKVLPMHLRVSEVGAHLSAYILPLAKMKALVGTQDGKLTYWDLATGDRLGTFCHDSPVDSSAADFCAKRALGGCQDGTLHFWDLERGERLWIIQAHNRIEHADAWEVIVAADFLAMKALSGGDWSAESGFGKFKLWDMETRSCVKEISLDFEDVGPVYSLQADFWIMRALSGHALGTLLHWDLQAGTCLQKLCQDPEVATMSFGSGVVVDFPAMKVLDICYDGSLRFWSLVSGHCTQMFKVWSDSAATFPDDYHDNLLVADLHARKALSASEHGLRCWCLSTGRYRHLPVDAGIVGLAADFDAARALIGYDNGHLLFLDLTTDTCTKTLEGPSGIHCLHAVF